MIRTIPGSPAQGTSDHFIADLLGRVRQQFFACRLLLPEDDERQAALDFLSINVLDVGRRVFGGLPGDDIPWDDAAFAAWLHQDPRRALDPGRAWRQWLAMPGHVRPVAAAEMRGER